MDLPAYDNRWRERKNGEFQSGVEDNRWWWVFWKWQRLQRQAKAGKSRMEGSADQLERPDM